MSAQEVAKLEALLARIHSRKHLPRERAESAAGDITLASAASAVAAVVPAAQPTPKPATPATAAKTATATTAPAAQPTPKPAMPVPAPVAAVTRPAVSAATPAVAAPRPGPVAAVPPAPATPAPPTPAPVHAAAPVTSPPPSRSIPPEDLEVEVEQGMAEVDLEGLDEEGVEASALSDSVADLDQVAGRSHGDEEVPGSSRRPIQMQPPLHELAFGDAADAKPPHPVPPESRRQVAIPPASDADGDFASGVRATPELEQPVAATAAKTAPPAAAAQMKADVTRPTVGGPSPAVFHGTVPVVAPSTFGDLLDETLSL